MPKREGREKEDRISSIAVTIPSDSESEDDDFDSREPTDAELVKYHEQEQLRKLFIGNLSYDTNSEMLRDYFGKYGNISDCNVPTDAKTRLSKGFGFVIYRESRVLDEVMKLRPHKLDGRVLEPRRAIRREEANNPAANASTTKLYIGPLQDDITQEDLRSYFKQHGNVLEVERKLSKDFGFITFDDFDPVDKCVNMKKHRIKFGAICAIAKKGLTKKAMAEAESRYREKKTRRAEREEREKRDYEAARNGRRSGYRDDGHRRYPKDFGQEPREKSRSNRSSRDRDRDRESDSRHSGSRSSRREELSRYGYDPYSRPVVPPPGYPAIPTAPRDPYADYYAHAAYQAYITAVGRSPAERRRSRSPERRDPRNEAPYTLSNAERSRLAIAAAAAQQQQVSPMALQKGGEYGRAGVADSGRDQGGFSGADSRDQNGYGDVNQTYSGPSHGGQNAWAAPNQSFGGPY